MVDFYMAHFPYSIMKILLTFSKVLGVALKEEDHGRMFPVSNKAKDVVNALLTEMDRLHVEMRLETRVEKLLMDDEKILGVRLDSGEEIRIKSCRLSCRWKSSSSNRYLQEMGIHGQKKQVIQLPNYIPTEVPLLSNEPFIVAKELQGLALRDVAVSVLNAKGKTLITHQMDMLFTHFGLSGPAILRCSQFVVKERMKNGNVPVDMKIDSLPSMNEEASISTT